MKDYISKSLVLDIIYQMLDEEGTKGGLISAYETANRVRDLATEGEAIDQINASIADIKDNLNKLYGTVRTLREGVLQDLPSAQPEKRTNKRTETHECDLINRQEAIYILERLMEEGKNTDDEARRMIIDCINTGIRLSIKALQTMETATTIRKTGHWIVRKSPDKYHCDMMQCSECGFDDVAETDEYKFCPKCGAKMITS